LSAAKPIAGISAEKAAASAQARAGDLIGRTLADRYRIDGLAAVGGMAAIYKGEHVHTRKEIAVKVLHPETEGFPELVARFEREAIACSRINHPNVVSVIDFGRFDKGSFFLVLEYLVGQTLRDLMRDGPVDPVRAAHVARQLAAGLGAAHQRGIIHRDVKPRNVMVLPAPPVGEGPPSSAKGGGKASGPQDFVKLIDFGFAKVPEELLKIASEDDFQSRKSLTAAGVVFGTVAYMAPEAALGMRSLGPAADLYAVGIILYEMLSGKHPFDAADLNALFLQQRKAIPPAFSVRSPGLDIPRSLETITRRLLEKEPDKRFEDAFVLIAALDAAMGGMRGARRPSARPDARGEGKWSPQLLGRAVQKEPKRTSLAPIIIGVLSVLSAVLIVLLFARDSREPVKMDSPAESATGAAASAPKPASTSTKLRGELARAADAGDGTKGGRALLALADADPAAFADRDVRESAATVVAHLGAKGGDTADAVFDALTRKLGGDGLEVLYGVAHAGQAASANRAMEILRRRDVLEREPAALRIAVELEQAGCDHKAQLFPRAAKEGDARALALLEKLHAPDCNARSGECCFRRDGLLEKAIADIRARE
jgi:serine/threonine-protein kinase